MKAILISLDGLTTMMDIPDAHMEVIQRACYPRNDKIDFFKDQYFNQTTIRMPIIRKYRYHDTIGAPWDPKDSIAFYREFIDE